MAGRDGLMGMIRPDRWGRGISKRLTSLCKAAIRFDMGRFLRVVIAILGWHPALRAAEAPPLAHAAMGVPNGCFVETVALLDDYAAAFGPSAWTRMLQWGATEEEETVAGHAVAVVEARGKLWCWDVNFGWSAMAIPPAKRDEVATVAVPLTARNPNISPRSPAYRFDFPQTPETTARPAPAGREGPAKTVAARLARHRPVNLAEFSCVENGVTRRSAAVVFLFHGRYCIYTPEKGTVPFLRATGSVQLTARITAGLRRMYAGAVTEPKSVAW